MLKKLYYRRMSVARHYHVALIAYGYEHEVPLNDENETINTVFAEKIDGKWHVTEALTGLRFEVVGGFKTRKSAFAWVDERAERLNECVDECLLEDKIEPVHTLKSMNMDEYVAEVDRVHAEKEEQKEKETMKKNEKKSDYRAFFKDCETLEDAKHLYFKESMKVHPDRGGDTETMQKLNEAYEAACKRLNSTHKSMKGETYTTDTAEAHEAPEWFVKFVDAFVAMAGVEVELVGTWLYVKGDTKKYKDELKEMGFRWSGKKQAWYKVPADYRRPKYKRGGWTMERCEKEWGVKATYTPEERKEVEG